MFYDEVLDGLVDSFSAGRGSAKAWDFLKKAAFGDDYATVVSIGTTKTNDAAVLLAPPQHLRQPHSS